MTLENLEMYFHPLMDINKEHIVNEKIVDRTTIKVLTYNVFLRPPFAHNNEDDYKDERLIDIVQRINNYDVLCFQEAFGFANNRKHELVRYANQSGLFYYTYGDSPTFFQKALVDGGSMVLSR
jgi:endonuclease/exonuclease/phosphatase family metal-dependent hydrolase